MFNLYPYTDFHELNLDMILRMMKDLHKEWTDFEAVNKITNAGAWDITKQYQAWTIVSDNNIGYISLKPVPAGVAITNIEYWGVIANYDILIGNLSEKIAYIEESAGISVENYDAVGDGFTDDTTAFSNAINDNLIVYGNPEHRYKIADLQIDATVHPVTIRNCNFVFDPHDAATDQTVVGGVTVSGNLDVKFIDCTFTSSLTMTPALNLLNGQSTGLASNVHAILAGTYTGNLTVERCKFKNIFAIHTNSNASIRACIMEDVEMGISSRSGGEISISDLVIKISKLTASPYYHSFYVQECDAFHADNIIIEETGSGQCGNHLHFYSPDNTLNGNYFVLDGVLFRGPISTNLIQSGTGLVKVNDLKCSGGISTTPILMSRNGSVEINGLIIDELDGYLVTGRNSCKIENGVINGVNIALTDRCEVDLLNVIVNASGQFNVFDDAVVGTAYTFRAKGCEFNCATVGNIVFTNQYNYISDCKYIATDAHTVLELPSARGLMNSIYMRIPGLTDFTTVAASHKMPFDGWFYYNPDVIYKRAYGIS